MLAEFFGVLLLLVVGLLLASTLLAVPRVLAPRRSFSEKDAPAAAAPEPSASGQRRFDAKFVLVALLFVSFELEAVFFHPWGALFRALGGYGLAVMAVFSVPLVLGLAYQWRKGALEW